MTGERGDLAPTVPTEVVETLIGVWRAWSSLGEDLTEEQWKTATDLPGWTVQDTLSHVVGIERMLEGLPPAPPRTNPSTGEPHVRNTLGESNENEVAARRDRAGADVLAEWNEVRLMRETTLTAGDAAFYAQPMITPVGPGTMADFLSIRILDCWVHEQDVRRALGHAGNEVGAAAEHTVDRLLRSLPMVVGKRAACPEGGAVALSLTGPVARRVTCEVHDGRAGFVDEPQRPPLATVEMDSRDYVLLANGRRPVHEVAGRVRVIGSTPAGEEIGWRVVGGLDVMM